VQCRDATRVRCVVEELGEGALQKKVGQSVTNSSCRRSAGADGAYARLHRCDTVLDHPGTSTWLC